jgi:hypothetical protein
LTKFKADLTKKQSATADELAALACQIAFYDQKPKKLNEKKRIGNRSVTATSS